MDKNQIALVNQNDNVIGFKDKQQVHIDGDLHRAFSILICNGNGQMLIHKRAFSKYHSPGLWTNACCSHLTQGEEMQNVIFERLKHEMGITCNLNHLFTFHYRVELDNGLIENEIDWVYVGKFEGSPNPNPDEVNDWKWVDIDWLLDDIEENPDSYTYWFKYILQNHKEEVVLAIKQCSGL
ncbi:isopentenyl-diphosphate Delta-isomerase [Tenuifilum thalassicum]|jgi:isopentenyl-diphosphate delta-isomerase|uniref:Isopentenyl-diphosphate delta-isomerase n=1 Tax=Tenuifilum thalassicum TaxID=2590900 RepID=A0A7D4C8I6_9BACT|nr:isopentenyl-diphosphate Delta-isomerase [Tenuifilum thalassicum]QKG79582.1 isopentenyl-diphosphate Delta-isomerase [Tenuifilum thalassicum]